MSETEKMQAGLNFSDTVCVMELLEYDEWKLKENPSNLVTLVVEIGSRVTPAFKYCETIWMSLWTDYECISYIFVHFMFRSF